MYKPKRDFSIDVLRGIAVLLVLFRHFHSTDYTIFIPYLEKIGWLGVDLFFVLSGFLISTLLYNEIDKTGKLDFKRFFIRRGFKIYPSFYFFILFIVLYKIFSGKPLALKEIFTELFFMQSYLNGLAVHTWSLGVEEHFYVFLPLCFIGILKFTKSNKINSKSMNILFIFILLYCLSIRILNVVNFSSQVYKFLFNTHIRIDSLFFGVFIAYYYRYSYTKLKELMIRFAPLSILYSLIVFTTAFYFDNFSKFVTSVGFTLYYIGFGLILLLVLFKNEIFNLDSYWSTIVRILCKPIAFIGFYSYTIYLWHIPAEGIINRLNMYYEYNIAFAFSIYFIISVLAGVLSSKLIEQPFLKLREKYYSK